MNDNMESPAEGFAAIHPESADSETRTPIILRYLRQSHVALDGAKHRRVARRTLRLKQGLSHSV